MRVVKPLLLGYQRIRITRSVAEVERARVALVTFSDREGFALAEIFVEADESRPFSALCALIEACRRIDVAVVAVPTLSDLGMNTAAQLELRQRLRRETGVPVLVVEGHGPARIKSLPAPERA